jgi:uncharacterized protein YkwD
MTFTLEPFNAEKVRAAVNARNALRAEAKLPLLSADDEIATARAH